MEVQILVTLDIDGVPTPCPTDQQLQESAREAIENAVQYFQGEGFRHTLQDITGIEIQEVEIQPPVQASIPFCLVDQADPKTPHVTGSIKVDANGIYIAIDGYGEKAAEDGAGTPVGMELYEGKVRVMVWGDINDEDAIILEMDGAKESSREPDDDLSGQIKDINAEIAARPVCDECGSTIPVVNGGGLANKHHKESCSLFDSEAD
jgi:hypothetical protein